MESEAKSRLESAVWATTTKSNSSDRVTLNPMLESYFIYCQREIRQAAILGDGHTAHLDSILSAIRLLRQNCAVAKMDLVDFPNNQAVIDLGLRLMLMTGCQASGTVGGDIFRPRWKKHESLVKYVDRVYPQSDTPAEGRGAQPISLNKLGADYLKTCANINIRWTDHLTDHLLLLRGSDWKSLYVFAHPAFISRALQSLSDAEIGCDLEEDVEERLMSYEKALSRGCLPPSLLHETLVTLDILFPPVGDIKSRRLLRQEVGKYGLDYTLLLPLQFQSTDHDSPNDARKPTDVNGLYSRFPFWAARLEDLWMEAEDPAPISYIGRLTDQKKSPRFTYWCGVLALTVAILFGVVETVLAALQVWISYCLWLDDPTINGCGLKGRFSSVGTLSRR